MRLIWSRYLQFSYSKPIASYRLKVNHILGGQDGFLAFFPKTPSVKLFEASATSLFKKRCQIYWVSLSQLWSGQDSNLWSFGSFPPNEVPTLPHDLPEKLMVTFTIFDLSLSWLFFHFFLRDFHFEVNVNLVTNRTLFSFKLKKFLRNYPLPTDFS